MYELQLNARMMSLVLLYRGQSAERKRQNMKKTHSMNAVYCGSVNNTTSVRLRTAYEKCTHIEI